MDDTNRTPDATPTTPVDPAPAAAAAPATAPAPRRSRTRGLLITGGAVLAAVLLAGGGLAVGAAIAEGDDSDDRISSAADTRDDASRDAGDDSSRDDSTRDDSAGSGSAATAGTTSADDFIAFADAASAVADGDVVSIEWKRDGGAEVKLEAQDGSETEVRVGADGTASVVSTDGPDDDGAPRSVLDAAAIRAIFASALAQTDGRVLEIEADDDAGAPYEVTVVTAAGDRAEMKLDGSFGVVSTDSDD